MRVAVATLFVLSVLAAAAVGFSSDDPQVQARGSTTTVLASTTTSAPPATAAPLVVPAPEETPAPSTTLPVPATAAVPPPPTTAAAPPAPGEGVPKVLISPRGIVLPVQAREGNRFRVETPCGRTTLISEGTPVNEATVVLDAGHGGAEPGAVSPGGLAEKGVNQAVVDHATAALERAGVKTVRTRTGDYRMTLGTRARVATALKPKAFVSVHHNAEPDGAHPGPGAETYYQVASPDSKRLAGLLYEEIVRALAVYQVAWVADTDAGAKYRRNTAGDDYYGILRRTQGVPAALAELAFVSNPPEAELISRPDVQKVEGEAVARAVLRFLGTSDPGSGFVEPYPRSSPAGSGGGTSPSCVDPAL